MFFQNRQEAGKKLAEKLFDQKIIKNKKMTIIISLLRGGVIVGWEVAKKFNCQHIALPVAKIRASNQEELAIGALCFDKIYLNQSLINSLLINKKTLIFQINQAKEKLSQLCQEFNIKKENFLKVKEKEIILIDDGIATGATINAAFLFLKFQKPKKIILASPVASIDFNNPGFNQLVFLHQDPFFSSVSQFYEHFPQLTNEEVKEKLEEKINQILSIKDRGITL